MTTSLQQFIRHAEVYGVDFVFESAVGDLADDELDALARRLATINPQWRFPETFSNGRSGAEKAYSTAEKRNAKGDSNSRARGAVCAECGVTFLAVRSTARYCSTACRVRSHRRAA